MTNNLIKLRKIEKLINSSAKTQEEREELWKIVEEIVHHRITKCILDNLDKKHHNEFLTKLEELSFTNQLIDFLEEKGTKNIKDKISQDIDNIELEILQELNS